MYFLLFNLYKKIEISFFKKTYNFLILIINRRYVTGNYFAIQRKNNQFEYVQARNDQSPYRFQRNNLNLSPGVSPMRCRTPTRNISPLTISNINNNNNQRTHSPIKLVNPMINGFYRN